MARRSKTGNSKAGRLRIVAGNWRSRLLDIAEVEGLRPTSERIRETLFNWLAPGIYGKRCLDLFAGTGALGLEALSRGAAEVVFVEHAPTAARTLARNIETLDAQGATVLRQDAKDFLGVEDTVPFDIVFLDPPFAEDMLSDLCRLLEERGFLSDDGLIYLEQDRAQAIPGLPDNWRIQKNKTAGNVRYMLVQRTA